MTASSLSHHLASAARSDRGHSFILLKDDGDQGRSRAERRLLPDSQLHGSYPETAFEEVIETDRGGTWTSNAQTGEVKSPKNQMSGFPTYQDLTHGCDRTLVVTGCDVVHV
jgi:hypothetical protein